MKTRSKLILVGACGALLMALAVGSASANRLSISHGSLFKAIFRPLRFVSAGVTASSCEVTLEGSFHSGTIRKVERALVGHISRASVGACTTGSATIRQETLPWHIQYLGFVGRLPAISGVRVILVGASYRLHEGIFGRECTSTTTEAEPAAGIAELEAMEAGGNINVRNLRADETREIECAPIGRNRFEAVATVTETSTGTKLLVRLI